jgi:hypothetical protein
MPPVYWAIELLTLDALIDGWMDINHADQSYILNPFYWHNLTGIQLQSVMVQSTGSEVPYPSGNVPAIVVGAKTALIGVIPKDENSLAALLKNNSAVSTAAVQLLAGSYQITGTLLNPYPLSDVNNTIDAPCLALKAVEINRITPGSRLKGLKAQAMLVNTGLIQFMTVHQ